MRFRVRWGHWDEDPPPLEWLVDGMIPRSSVSLLSAEPGSYKSYMAIELAISVASGRKAFGSFRTRQGRSLYVDFDGGEDITRRRVSQLYPDASLPSFGYLSGSEVGNVFEDTLWSELRDDAPDLLIIDTLAAGSSGIDENDKRIGDVLVRARLLAQSRGTSSLFLHHLNAMGGVRGSSALRGNPDCDWRAEKRGPTMVSLRCQKMKHAEAPQPFIVDVGGLSSGEGLAVR